MLILSIGSVMEEKRFVTVNLNNEEHCNALVRLMNDYMQDEMGIGESMPNGLGLRIIEGLRKHPAYMGFFVCIGEEFAALANCNLSYSADKTHQVINIHDFVVSPAHRQKGVGLFLLKSMEEFAWEHDYCRINLEVRQDNVKAQSLCIKAGFQRRDPFNYFWEKRMDSACN